MKKQKLSLHGVKSALSRAELKKIMGGGSTGECSYCAPGAGGYTCCGCYYTDSHGVKHTVLYTQACALSNCTVACAAYGYSGQALACSLNMC